MSTSLFSRLDFSRRVAPLGFAIALFFGGAGAATVLPGRASQADAEAETSAAASCAFVDPAAAAAPWIRTELFFGTSKPDGSAVTDGEWRAFLDSEITPHFPDGLTVLSGAGQWQEADGDIIQEQSKIVVLLFPPAAAAESDDAIEEIRTEYEARFDQESVLRADDDRPVCTSF